MLPSEIPWVLYEGSGDRGPFPLVVDGTPISYAEVAHIRVTRFAVDGTATVLVEGTDYQLSATSALPDLNDVSRPVTAANLTLKVAQPVLAEDEYILIERIAPADQSLSYTQAGGFSSSVSERNLDAIVRVIQQLFVSVSRGIVGNRLDPIGQLELPRAEDRADKFFYFDTDGNPALASPSVGLGDLISSNNLSDLTDASAARTNLGLTSLATTALSAVFQVANNLSEGNATTMRANIGVYSTTQSDALITTHVALSDPHTQYARKAAANTFTANQTFSGSDADVATLYRAGVAAKLRFIESTNNNAWGIRNNANTLTFDYNSTDRLTLDGSGNLTLGAGLTTAGRNRLHGGPFSMPAAGAHDNATQIGNTDLNYGVLIGALSSGTGFIQAQRVDGTATTYQLNLNPNGSPVAVGGQLEITGGALSNTNGLHLYFTSNFGRISALENSVAWRDLWIDGAITRINANSAGPVVLAGQSVQVDYGSSGSSLLYIGGANNQDAFFALRANAGRSRGIGFYTGASSIRWFMETTSAAEGGANAGSNFAISNWSDAGGYLSTSLAIARATGIATFGAAIVAGGPVNLKSYTVAGLPAGSAGDTAYASNGRKNGEGGGAGTGVMVFKDGTAWRACDTGATVAA